MAENLIWFALGCALISGLFMGSRSSAWPLLCSGIAGQILDNQEIFADWRVSLIVDAVVFSFIVRRNLPLADKLILALFPVAWFAYAVLDDPARYHVTAGVVIAQLLLTIPLTRFQTIGGSVSHGPRRTLTYEGA